MSITIKEIAKLAGVSRGTVDRVLNDRGNVAPDISDKILKIAQEHGYKKNVLASRLAMKEQTIAVVLPDYNEDDFWKLPYQGVNKVKNKLGDYGLLIEYFFYAINSVKSYDEAFLKAIRKKPDGILVAPVFLKETLTYFSMAMQNNIPTVCINSEIDFEGIVSYVGQDSFLNGLTCGRLFDMQNSDRKKIIVLTLGHSNKNASHIQRKIDGLRQYNYNNLKNYIVDDIVIEDFKNISALEELSEKLLQEKENIRGVLFTNSRAYHFMNNTDFREKCLSDTTFIGFDLIAQNIGLLENRSIDFLLNQNAEKQGYFGILSLFNHFVYNKEIQTKQYLPTDIVIKENYQTYLNERANLLKISI